MTESRDSKDISPLLTDEYAAAWMEEHLPELRQSVLGQRFLYWSLGISFVVGLAAHVGGYVLLLSAPRGLLGLVADLLHALGWSLWTGAVVAVFVQVIPEAKRRQIKEAVDAYEALRREKAHVVGHRDEEFPERPHARPAERENPQKRSRNRARKGR